MPSFSMYPALVLIASSQSWYHALLQLVASLNIQLCYSMQLPLECAFLQCIGGFCVLSVSWYPVPCYSIQLALVVCLRAVCSLSWYHVCLQLNMESQDGQA